MSDFEKVQEALATVLNKDISNITFETSQDNLGAWDSLAQINFLTALEEEFDMEFEVEEFTQLKSIKAILERLKSEG